MKRVLSQWLMAAGLAVLATAALLAGFGAAGLLLGAGAFGMAALVLSHMGRLPQVWLAHLEHQRWLRSEQGRLEAQRRAARDLLR